MISRKPRWRSRSTELPGRPRTSRILPSFLPISLSRNLADISPISMLVLVDHHHLVGVEDVVERHDHDVVAVGEPDHAVEALGADRDGDDRVEALVDEVLDGAELRGGVGAGRDDLELLDVLLDARLLGERLGGLDHLDSPGVADEAVDQGDPVGPSFFSHWKNLVSSLQGAKHPGCSRARRRPSGLAITVPPLRARSPAAATLNSRRRASMFDNPPVGWPGAITRPRPCLENLTRRRPAVRRRSRADPCGTRRPS